MYKPKPKCHGCCIIPKRTSLSDVACSSRSVSDFGWRLISFNGRVCRGFRSAKWPGLTQSSPARPGPAHAPRRPTPPPYAPPPPLPLSFGFPAQQPPSPTSLSLWCPRDWRRRSPEFGPRGELPSLPFSSLSLSPSPSSSLPLRAPPLLSPARARVPARRRAPPLPGAPLSRPPVRRPAPPLHPRRPGPRRGLPGPRRGLPGPRRGVPAPRRGPLPPARPLPRRAASCARRPGPSAWSPAPNAAPAPARSPLRAASRPRRDSRGLVYPPNAFPRAQTHARGDYFWVCS
jgi:hypothetical protein